MESKVEFWQIYRDLYEHEVAIRNHSDMFQNMNLCLFEELMVSMRMNIT